MSKFSQLFVLLTALSLGGCAGVTITENGSSDFTYRPHYEESKSFFLWGLIGEHHIDVTQICRKLPVKQMQSVFTASDLALITVTAGLYFPRTAKVWCHLENEEQ